VILTCFPSIPESTGDLLVGDAGGIQPVKVWLGYVAPIFKKVFPLSEVKTLAMTPSTVAHSLISAAASLAGMTVTVWACELARNTAEAICSCV